MKYRPFGGSKSYEKETADNYLISSSLSALSLFFFPLLSLIEILIPAHYPKSTPANIL
ncbi:MAG TPA: hypothetical protein VG935_03840 [Patescibacteria group bacterium]|nr:hypothetical protein [Patescibacteria group bacterium]